MDSIDSIVASGVQFLDDCSLSLSDFILPDRESDLLVVESLLLGVCLLLRMFVFGISSDS